MLKSGMAGREQTTGRGWEAVVRGSEGKAKAQVLTVHVSFMFILNEGITTGFSRTLTVYHVDLQGRQKAVNATSYRAAPPTPLTQLLPMGWGMRNRVTLQESQGALTLVETRGAQNSMWESEGPAKQAEEGSWETQHSDGGEPQIRPKADRH